MSVLSSEDEAATDISEVSEEQKLLESIPGVDEVAPTWDEVEENVVLDSDIPVEAVEDVPSAQEPLIQETKSVMHEVSKSTHSSKTTV
ncbi:hypothetical protein [Vibrio lentus]|uniref:hypothetical protein n=1 Tax=Vibrio lentus TaxID=136468 RepID=UPI000C854C72|nr:hypothetical protein [Vibrio lentus]PMG76717.1 hypothetical protein BCU86_02535 [Vibrio lentus]